MHGIFLCIHLEHAGTAKSQRMALYPSNADLDLMAAINIGPLHPVVVHSPFRYIRLGQSAGVHAWDISLHTPRACWNCQVAAPLGCSAANPLEHLPLRLFSQLSIPLFSPCCRIQRPKLGIPHTSHKRVSVNSGVGGVPPSIEIEIVK
jgi:hypothetical protein